MRFTVRAYRPQDRDGVYHVACETAWFGEPMDQGFGGDRLFVATATVGLYLERHPDLTWVVGDGHGGVFGYITGTDDTMAFQDWWGGELARQVAAGVAQGAMRLGWRDWQLVARQVVQLPQGPLVSEALARRFPAHLHINLLPATQGQGLGKRLMNTFCRALKKQGVPGVHLVTTSLNRKAVGFYGELGFRVVARRRVGSSWVLGQPAHEQLVFAQKFISDTPRPTVL